MTPGRIAVDQDGKQTDPEHCPTGGNHDWEFRDESFDHEFGTEVVHYYECSRCSATRLPDAGDVDAEYGEWLATQEPSDPDAASEWGPVAPDE